MDVFQVGYNWIGEIWHGRLWPDWGLYRVKSKFDDKVFKFNHVV